MQYLGSGFALDGFYDVASADALGFLLAVEGVLTTSTPAADPCNLILSLTHTKVLTSSNSNVASFKTIVNHLGKDVHVSA